MSVLVPFSFVNLPVRGRLIRLTGLHAHIPSLVEAPPVLAGALADMLALAALLMHEGEKQHNISLQVQHEASHSLLFARVSKAGEMKAYANRTACAAAANGKLPWEGDTTGLFAVTLEPKGGGEPIQSIIPLSDGSPAACMARYFNESVQTPTKLASAQSDDTAAIMLLQGLPGLNTAGDDWHRLGLMLQSARPEELLSGTLTPHDLIHRLFAEDDIMAHADEPLAFSAHNPREAMLNALASLPAEELQGLLDKGPIEMRDETSGATEIFTAADVHHLLTTGQS